MLIILASTVGKFVSLWYQKNRRKKLVCTNRLREIYPFSNYLLRKTNFRGVLWIHAASKVPEPELIKQIESQYQGIW